MPASTPRLVLYLLLAALGVASVFVTHLSPFALLLAFIAALSLGAHRPRPLIVLNALGALGAFVGFLRFLVSEAMPGIVQGGTTAAESAAVSRLRALLFAEDSMRKLAAIDPDGDGIGSAALIGELTGSSGLRGGAPLAAPLLERYAAPVETAIGPAIEMGGYFFAVCLPTRSGGFSARLRQEVDEELAERRFLAYAWPAGPGLGLGTAFFLDEHEHILRAPSRDEGERSERVGALTPPACDDAIAAASRGQWKPWRGKRPRRNLPGDRS